MKLSVNPGLERALLIVKWVSNNKNTHQGYKKNTAGQNANNFEGENYALKNVFIVTRKERKTRKFFRDFNNNNKKRPP